MGGASPQAPGAPPTSSTGVTPDMLRQMLSQVSVQGSGVTPAAPPTGKRRFPHYAVLHTMCACVSVGGVGSQQPVVRGPAQQPAVPGPAQQQQAEALYQAQLEQLAAMGFTDRQRNLSGRSLHPSLVGHCIACCPHLSDYLSLRSTN